MKICVGHKKLRELRNKLVHFYTVTSLGLVNYRCEETNKITKATQNLSQSISPQDLLEIAKGAFLLLLQKWDTDSGSKDFQERMKFVEEVVERDSPYSFDLKSLTEEEK